MTFFLCKGISYLVGHKGHAYGRKTSITSVMIFEGTGAAYKGN
ncbi:hypothetical protein [Bacteroides caccae]|jgi:hypothetical protein|uniref:Uncharacterized protein n=1 Tax=Bacteroides caccae TaxID=47678 RepID=A0AA95BXU9_9BACE|nr:hypothetical protein [Bacteroides caccae]MCZ2725335.1 hypothetical protein [Bacteroides caccae]MDC7128366.1 hypothetical protein [Bacteroides caccae]UVQ96270.1 hypothetical protein NXW23_18445 [Bacteroides caccae]